MAAGVVGRLLRQLPADRRLARPAWSRCSAARRRTRLVERAPIYLDRRPPALPPTGARRDDRLERLEVRGLTYRYPDDRARHRRRRPARSSAARSRSSPAASAPARRRCCGRCSACCRATAARSAGTAGRSTTRRPSSSRRAAPTRRRCRACSARRCATTSCWACPTTSGLAEALAAGRAGARPGRARATGWTRWSARAACKLSGGQVQRAAAARMFVRAAELLVFDDLSSALDVETERALWERLVAPGRDLTCLAVSHRRAGAAPRRPDHRAERRPRRGGGHARRAAGDARRRCGGSGPASPRPIGSAPRSCPRAVQSHREDCEPWQ